jgi:hypothetical protein
MNVVKLEDHRQKTHEEKALLDPAELAAMSYDAAMPSTYGGPCRSRYDPPEGRSRRGPQMSTTRDDTIAGGRR